MGKSISYSFLLNIIILFVFVCVAVVGGIISYYRAFRANSAIISEIEKYEGYNCVSKKSIEQKLNNISYYTPFNVTCRESYGEKCATNEVVDSDGSTVSNGTYAVVAYNLDYDYKDANDVYLGEGTTGVDSKMNSVVGINVFKENGIYTSSNKGTKQYQFGVYTYMYFDLPIVSNMLKIPVFSKTKVLYEFRDLRLSYDLNDDDYIVNLDIIPEDVVEKQQVILDRIKEEAKNYQTMQTEGEISESSARSYAKIMAGILSERYYYLEVGFFNNLISEYVDFYDTGEVGMSTKLFDSINLRDAYRYSDFKEITELGDILKTSSRECGFVYDWSLY